MMKYKQMSQLVIAAILVISFLVGCGGTAPTTVLEAPAATSASKQAAASTPEPETETPTPSLPGTEGTSMSIINTPNPNIKFADVYMTAEDSLFGGTKTLPAVFPSETTQLFLVVEFSPPPPNGTGVSAEVLGNEGIIELEEAVSSAFSFGDSATVTVPLKPSSGKYMDGPYQATLSINGSDVALLNWTVGEW